MPIVSSPGTNFGYGQQPVFGGSINTWSDGSSNLVISDNADLDINTGTQPFTIEFFVYRLTTNTTPYFFEKPNAYALYLSSGSLVFQMRTTGYVIGSYSTLNEWSHILISRDSNSEVRVFINGSQLGSTVTANLSGDNANNLSIGNRLTTNGANALRGIISNFRFINGTALHTSNFQKPTAPLTNITNTKALLTSDTQSTFINNTSATALTITNNRCFWDSKTPFS